MSSPAFSDDAGTSPFDPIEDEPVAPRREKRTAGKKVPGGFRHGTSYAYTSKRCRCAECAAGQRARRAGAQAKRPAGAPKAQGTVTVRRDQTNTLGILWGMAATGVAQVDRPVGATMALQSGDAGAKLDLIIRGTWLDAILQRLQTPSPRLEAAASLALPLVLVALLERRPEAFAVPPVRMAAQAILDPLAPDGMDLPAFLDFLIPQPAPAPAPDSEPVG